MIFYNSILWKEVFIKPMEFNCETLKSFIGETTDNEHIYPFIPGLESETQWISGSSVNPFFAIIFKSFIQGTSKNGPFIVTKKSRRLSPSSLYIYQSSVFLPPPPRQGIGYRCFIKACLRHNSLVVALFKKVINCILIKVDVFRTGCFSHSFVSHQPIFSALSDAK